MVAEQPRRAERSLVAILAADVAGYSRLIGLDEEGTLGRLRTLHHELIEPSIADHHGRIVKTTGDGILIELPRSLPRSGQRSSCSAGWRLTMPGCRLTDDSNSASASIWAMSWSKAMAI